MGNIEIFLIGFFVGSLVSFVVYFCACSLGRLAARRVLTRAIIKKMNAIKQFQQESQKGEPNGENIKE